jgi:D-aminoacyl-tRNA deacylase
LNDKNEISKGLMVLVGVTEEDEKEDVFWLVKKVLSLRIFNDENGVMNNSILDIKGQMLIVSQFTLHALTKKGNRPSYIKAAKPDLAIPLYESFVNEIEKVLGKAKVRTGKFGANMQVELINDGPVTIIIDSKNKE